MPALELQRYMMVGNEKYHPVSRRAWNASSPATCVPRHACTRKTSRGWSSASGSNAIARMRAWLHCARCPGTARSQPSCAQRVQRRATGAPWNASGMRPSTAAYVRRRAGVAPRSAGGWQPDAPGPPRLRGGPLRAARANAGTGSSVPASNLISTNVLLPTGERLLAAPCGDVPRGSARTGRAHRRRGRLHPAVHADSRPLDIRLLIMLWSDQQDRPLVARQVPMPPSLVRATMRPQRDSPPRDPLVAPAGRMQ